MARGRTRKEGVAPLVVAVFVEGGVMEGVVVVTEAATTLEGGLGAALEEVNGEKEIAVLVGEETSGVPTTGLTVARLPVGLLVLAACTFVLVVRLLLSENGTLLEFLLFPSSEAK